MKQSRLESCIEITANYVSGFAVAWAVYAWIVLPVPWLLNSPFWVTVLFTVVSVLRSYLWRRFFNAELHVVAHQIARTFIRG